MLHVNGTLVSVLTKMPIFTRALIPSSLKLPSIRAFKKVRELPNWKVLKLGYLELSEMGSWQFTLCHTLAKIGVLLNTGARMPFSCSISVLLKTTSNFWMTLELPNFVYRRIFVYPYFIQYIETIIQ